MYACLLHYNLQLCVQYDHYFETTSSHDYDRSRHCQSANDSKIMQLKRLAGTRMPFWIKLASGVKARHLFWLPVNRFLIAQQARSQPPSRATNRSSTMTWTRRGTSRLWLLPALPTSNREYESCRWISPPIPLLTNCPIKCYLFAAFPFDFLSFTKCQLRFCARHAFCAYLSIFYLLVFSALSPYLRYLWPTSFSSLKPWRFVDSRYCQNHIYLPIILYTANTYCSIAYWFIYSY